MVVIVLRFFAQIYGKAEIYATPFFAYKTHTNTHAQINTSSHSYKRNWLLYETLSIAVDYTINTPKMGLICVIYTFCFSSGENFYFHYEMKLDFIDFLECDFCHSLLYYKWRKMASFTTVLIWLNFECDCNSQGDRLFSLSLSLSQHFWWFSTCKIFVKYISCLFFCFCIFASKSSYT